MNDSVGESLVMNKISFWDVVRFAWHHPSILELCLYKKHDKRIDELIDYLIDNIHRIKHVTRNDYVLSLSIDGNTYHIWRSNRFYAYMTDCSAAHGEKTRYCECKDLWSDRRPSLKHAIAFYWYFDGPERPVQVKKPESFILAKQEKKA